VQPGTREVKNRQMAVLGVLVFLVTFVSSAAWAGPPFVTDDPEPVEYHHAELVIASQHVNNKDGKEGTLPHVEFNYGIVPDAHLHLLVPLIRQVLPLLFSAWQCLLCPL
jgi:hypothetical protein